MTCRHTPNSLPAYDYQSHHKTSNSDKCNETVSNYDAFAGVWDISNDRIPFYWLVVFRLITTVSIAFTIWEYVWLSTRTQSSMLLRFSHLTVWFNILATITILVMWLELGTIMAKVSDSTTGRVIRCISSVSLTMQHPISWVVFFGYWIGAIVQTEHITIADAWMYMPGVACSDAARIVIQADGNSTVYADQVTTCLMAARVNILVHSLVPVLMSRQLSLCNVKTTTWTSIASYMMCTAYFICYIVYSERNGTCPYSEFCYLDGNFITFTTRVLGVILFIIGRITLSKSHILTSI